MQPSPERREVSQLVALPVEPDLRRVVRQPVQEPLEPNLPNSERRAVSLRSVVQDLTKSLVQ